MYREITNLTLKLLFFKKRKLKNSSLMRIFINFLLCLKLNDFEIDEWKMKNFKLSSIKILEQKEILNLWNEKRFILIIYSLDILEEYHLE